MPACTSPGSHAELAPGARTYRWIVESDLVLGGIALRNGCRDYIPWASHIGYGIRPGLWAGCSTRQVLGLDRVLAVCAVDNVASLKTDQAVRWRLRGRPGHQTWPARRYLIEP